MSRICTNRCSIRSTTHRTRLKITIRRWLFSITCIRSMRYIIISTYSTMHLYMMCAVMILFRTMEVAMVMIVCMPSMHVSMICMIPPAQVTMIITWIKTPIPSRMIHHISRSPKPTKNHRSHHIFWHNHVVITIYIATTHYRHTRCFLILAFHNHRCHVLIQILAYHCLYHYQVRTFFGNLHHSKEVNIPIVIQIKIRKSIIRIIQSTFKILNIFRFSKRNSHSFKVKIITHLITLCFYRHSLLRLQSYRSQHYSQYKQYTSHNLIHFR